MNPFPVGLKSVDCFSFANVTNLTDYLVDQELIKVLYLPLECKSIREYLNGLNFFFTSLIGIRGCNDL